MQNGHDSTSASSSAHPIGPSRPGSPSPLAPRPTGILDLPPELLDHLLTHVPPPLLQRTALSLQLVFPDAQISPRHLFRHITVRAPTQLLPLYRKLKSEGVQPDRGLLRHVRTFFQESWKGDADILNNALRWIPDVRVLMLHIGTNFSPEHLQEMFEEPRPFIERMELRFRPYVEQASYYQFLRGIYFDIAIEGLTKRWGETPSFTQLSIVVDLPPRLSAPPTALTTAANSVVPSAIPSAANSTVTTRVNSVASNLADLALESASTSTSDAENDHGGTSTPPTSTSNQSGSPHAFETPFAPKGYTGRGPFSYLSDRMSSNRPKKFAQPLVFFDIRCITAFGHSAAALHLTHLRLRVPSRDIVHVLVGSSLDPVFPRLRYLDVSTTNVRVDNTFAALLRNYARLEHLVLDRVNLFGFMARDKGPELCKELGDKLAVAGLARSKERERQLAAAEVRDRVRLAQASAARQAASRESPGSGSESEDEDGSGQSGDEAVVEDYNSPAAIAARQASAVAEEHARRIATARSRRGNRSAAISSFSIRDRPSRAGASAAAGAAGASAIPDGLVLPPPDRLDLVLPPLPTLKSVSIGGEAHSLSAARVRTWEEEFHRGWREGLGKVVGWANHVSERYERAMRKADEYHLSEIKQSSLPSASASKGKGKGKSALSKSNTTRPPLDIRLYRFPRPDEPLPPLSPGDPSSGLIPIPYDGGQKLYLEEYKLALADAELHANGQGPPGCVICTVPDCEGPSRRGDEGGRVDGRGGMGGKHRPGCGHLLGRAIWGWEGCD